MTGTSYICGLCQLSGHSDPYSGINHGQGGLARLDKLYRMGWSDSRGGIRIWSGL